MVPKNVISGEDSKIASPAPRSKELKGATPSSRQIEP